MKVGHYAKGCALHSQSSVSAAPQETKQNLLNCIAINNVSSYALQCNVHGVSFLIDTGAGVSLLDRRFGIKLSLQQGCEQPSASRC